MRPPGASGRITCTGSRWSWSAADLLAGVLLLFLLRALGRSPLAVLIYLWNPLVIFEVAHSAHVDALVLPLLAAAFLARLKGRPVLTGLLLGLAASMKLFPVLLVPALWQWKDDRPPGHGTPTAPPGPCRWGFWSPLG